MMSPLEQELEIPSSAFLPNKSQFKAYLSTVGGQIALDSTTSINSSKKCLLIGRQASCADIRIDHKSISRKHAVIYFDKSPEARSDVRMILKDLGGKFGCQVNHERVSSSRVLNDGDKIQFGNVREQIFTVHLPSQDEMNTVEVVQVNPTSEFIESPQEVEKPILTGRAAREADIAAMMASLDEEPTYTKYTEAEQGNHSLSETSATIMSPLASQHKLPLASHITFPVPHSSSSSSLITSTNIDPSGSRLIVGSSDNTLRFYDFNGMDLSAQPFKVVSVQEGHSIIGAVFSNTGDKIIVGTTSAQPVLIDRDGNQIIVFNKGDMYVTDMIKTDGHVAQITAVDWHPFDRHLCITSSLDGSVRIWNVEKNKTKFDKLCSDKEVYRIKCVMGKRTMVTSVVFSPSGREFACGTSCGSIQIWSSVKVGIRPEKAIFHAHGNGKAIHSLVYNIDGSLLASRSKDDDCVNLWETRQLSRSSKPVFTCQGLKGYHESMNCAFSPDGKVLVAGACAEPKSCLPSTLRFYHMNKMAKSTIDTNTSSSTATTQYLSPILEFNVGPKGISIVKVAWHKILNQIIVALSDGTIQMFFDDQFSKKGAIIAASKGLRKTDDLTLLLNRRGHDAITSFPGEIITPHALPIFREDNASSSTSTKRKREKDRKDPIKSHRPDLPGTGIKVSDGTSVGLNFQQRILASTIGKNKNIAGKDPREELFKFSKGKSYGLGDQKTILAEKTVEEEEEQLKRRNDE